MFDVFICFRRRKGRGIMACERSLRERVPKKREGTNDMGTSKPCLFILHNQLNIIISLFKSDRNKEEPEMIKVTAFCLSLSGCEAPISIKTSEDALLEIWKSDGSLLNHLTINWSSQSNLLRYLPGIVLLLFLGTVKSEKPVKWDRFQNAIQN